MSRRILIADGTVNDRIAFKAALLAARYDVVAVATAAEVVALLDTRGADLILIDADLPDLVESGLLDRMRSRDPMSPLSIIIATDDSSEARASWIEAGAMAVMARPVERSWLLTNLRGILRRQETRVELSRQVATARRLGFAEDASSFVGPPQISIVGTDRATTGRLARGLPDRIGYPVATRTPAEILSHAATGATVDLVLLSMDDVEETMWVLAELRAHPTTRRASIIVEHAEDNDALGARALDLGANALLRRDAILRERTALIAREVMAKRRADGLRQELDQSLRMAARDDLTGLFNRRYALQYLGDAAKRAVAAGRTYGVILADIDYFKQVNDRLGHAMGDRVLQRVANRLRDNVRDHDLVARVGGEEFLIVLSDAKPGEVLQTAERLREAVKNGGVFADAGIEDGVSVTISLGLACAETLDTEETMARADAALYRAKRSGRNRSRLACDTDILPIGTIDDLSGRLRAIG